MTVEFGDAVSAIAASLVSARRTLDSATASLGQRYAADETLRSLPVPAYTLAEATFDVPFVVDEVQPPPEEPVVPELPRRPPVRVGASEVASLRRGLDQGTEARLKLLLEEYDAVGKLYQRARTDPNVLVREPVPQVPEPLPEELDLLRTGASKAARDKLDRVLDEFRDMRSSLFAVAEAVEAATKPKLMVRLDAEALDNAEPDRIQRVRLTFRDQPLTTVDVDGSPVALT